MWYINDGKSLRPYSPPKMIPYQQKTPLTFMNLYVKNFDQNGLYTAKELEITHKLFFRPMISNWLMMILVKDYIMQTILFPMIWAQYLAPMVFLTGQARHSEITLVSFPMLLMLLCTPSWFLSALSWYYLLANCKKLVARQFREPNYCYMIKHQLLLTLLFFNTPM